MALTDLQKRGNFTNNLLISQKIQLNVLCLNRVFLFQIAFDTKLFVNGQILFFANVYQS